MVIQLKTVPAERRNHHDIVHYKIFKIFLDHPAALPGRRHDSRRFPGHIRTAHPDPARLCTSRDAAIFLMVLFVGRREMLFAACFGSALSDLLGGFPLWIVPTLVIKFFMADIAWRLIRPDHREMASLLRMTMGFLAGSLWMAVAYTLFGALLYDSLAAGLASAPGSSPRVCSIRLSPSSQLVCSRKHCCTAKQETASGLAFRLQLCLLKLQQGFFHRQAPGIAREAAITADDAMARHDDAQWIGPTAPPTA